LGHFNESRPKNLIKIPITIEFKKSINIENLEGGNNKTKRKISRWNIEKVYQKSLGHPLIRRACLHDEHLRLEHHPKNKNEGSKVKWVPRILMSPKGQQNSLEGQTHKVS
jgi:hypothetical protein